MDEEEENILYFKGHLEEFFQKKYEGELTKETLLEIVKNNTVLQFLEQKMEEEE